LNFIVLLRFAQSGSVAAP